MMINKAVVCPSIDICQLRTDVQMGTNEQCQCLTTNQVPAKAGSASGPCANYHHWDKFYTEPHPVTCGLVSARVNSS